MLENITQKFIAVSIYLSFAHSENMYFSLSVLVSNAKILPFSLHLFHPFIVSGFTSLKNVQSCRD